MLDMFAIVVKAFANRRTVFAGCWAGWAKLIQRIIYSTPLWRNSFRGLHFPSSSVDAVSSNSVTELHRNHAMSTERLLKDNLLMIMTSDGTAYGGGLNA